MSAETLPRQMPRVDSSGGNMAEIEWEEFFFFFCIRYIAPIRPSVRQSARNDELDARSPLGGPNHATLPRRSPFLSANVGIEGRSLRPAPSPPTFLCGPRYRQVGSSAVTILDYFTPTQTHMRQGYSSSSAALAAFRSRASISSVAQTLIEVSGLYARPIQTMATARPMAGK